ncbi:MAG: L,D-transpeptidase, partial [Verrucomicrobia bacterium]|nr:L,D-transpeptidase [Verrucomicrobiota bacterium]
SRKDLVVYLDGKFFKRYGVGTGKYGKTPLGEFEIYDKITEPVWWRPDGKEIPFGDPLNILGTRWMAIRATGDTPQVRGYGIHGTWDDSSIGKAESAGCIRMRNSEVEELFDLLPYLTPVRIVD